MAHRAVVEAVGIEHEFKATWAFIDNHRARSHSERVEGGAFRANFAILWILRYDIIINGPSCTVGREMPDDTADRFAIIRHWVRALDVIYCMLSDF
jgi:hypothetical protein